MRCPVCRAEVEPPGPCRRCRADLSLLFALETKRRRALDASWCCLAAGNFRRARALAAGASALRRDHESRQLQTLCRLMQGNYPAALAEYLLLKNE